MFPQMKKPRPFQSLHDLSHVCLCHVANTGTARKPRIPVKQTLVRFKVFLDTQNAKWVSIRSSGLRKVSQGNKMGKHRRQWEHHWIQTTPRPPVRYWAVLSRGSQGPGVHREGTESALTVARGSGWNLSNLSRHTLELRFPARCRSACASVARGSTSRTFWEKAGHRAFRRSKPARDFLCSISRWLLWDGQLIFTGYFLESYSHLFFNFLKYHELFVCFCPLQMRKLPFKMK